MPELNDHDLLVVINTKLERAISDISELKNNVVSDVDALKRDKADIKDFEDLSKRFDRVQRIVWMIAGGLTLLNALILLIVNLKK